MKTLFIIAVSFLLLFSSCGNTSGNKEKEAKGYSENAAGQQNLFSKNPDGKSGEKLKKKYKMHQLRDARTGLVVNSTNYPAEWKVISKPYYTIDQKIPMFMSQVEGPHNLKSFNTPVKFHIQYDDPQIVNYLPQNGIRNMVRNEVSTRQIFREEVQQRMENSGFTFQEERKMPRLEAWFEKEKQKNGLENGIMDLLVTQWINNKGQAALASITKISMRQNNPVAGFTMWFYSIEYLFVDKEHLESTIDEFVKATIHSKTNPQWDQYVAQLNQQRQRQAVEQMRISNMQHQQRMASRQAAFNAHQQRMQSLSAAQDANHAAFMNRNFGSASSTSHKQYINSIHEQETVYNPQTGNNYQVDAGSTEYWMDSEGNYIQNNDLFYTPNGDINLNNREWVKVGSAY